MNKTEFMNTIDSFADICVQHGGIDADLYEKYDVQRGLRDKNGNGVVSGLTKISTIEASKIVDGKKVPCEGRLYYRGYNIKDLVNGTMNNRGFGFEEVSYLLLFGTLPTREQLLQFTEILSRSRTLPTNFVRDVIMKAPSKDMMNSLSRSVLTLASYDPKASDISIPNVLRQCLMLISLFPVLAVYGYHAYNHYEKEESMYIHHPDPTLSTSENLLRLLRADKQYTPLEAHVLDLALILHMEHGGGNNSTFTTHVVTSSGTDTYATITAALSSLKGPRHGGANIKVVEMMNDLRANVKDTKDEDEVRNYLEKLLHKEAFDKKGLIYGMGHAVYSKSDPRAEILKSFVEKLSQAKGRHDDFNLYSMIERLAPEVISGERRMYKGVSANVDFFSGFVYSMLDIPLELFTPIFAIARIVGWSAHRIEELINMDKIIRPAYISVMPNEEYTKMEDRS
ncbi:citrate/2-methylcitrate synthase [Clostridium sp. AM58-1XD]|uniref:citrate/2-methylcitrate synthase n=1 Tax=Clostridium sp. AM58-1XD TaxID=2292307 RepID=UPI000E557972|nr:citrate/2-methylcitrate synthase [Clostridium sp. AM58-1XD]RGY98364.1 citrate/2-methylcitrate synthase [Clostridium sp. AM58-1XD]